MTTTVETGGLIAELTGLRNALHAIAGALEPMSFQATSADARWRIRTAARVCHAEAAQLADLMDNMGVLSEVGPAPAVSDLCGVIEPAVQGIDPGRERDVALLIAGRQYLFYARGIGLAVLAVSVTFGDHEISSQLRTMLDRIGASIEELGTLQRRLVGEPEVTAPRPTLGEILGIERRERRMGRR